MASTFNPIYLSNLGMNINQTFHISVAFSNLRVFEILLGDSTKMHKLGLFGWLIAMMKALGRFPGTERIHVTTLQHHREPKPLMSPHFQIPIGLSEMEQTGCNHLMPLVWLDETATLARAEANVWRIFVSVLMIILAWIVNIHVSALSWEQTKGSQLFQLSLTEGGKKMEVIGLVDLVMPLSCYMTNSQVSPSRFTICLFITPPEHIQQMLSSLEAIDGFSQVNGISLTSEVPGSRILPKDSSQS